MEQSPNGLWHEHHVVGPRRDDAQLLVESGKLALLNWRHIGIVNGDAIPAQNVDQIAGIGPFSAK